MRLGLRRRVAGRDSRRGVARKVRPQEMIWLLAGEDETPISAVRRPRAIFARRGITSTLKRMTKPQLIDIVSVKTGRDKAEVEVVLESVLGAIAEALHENQRVDLRGFGSFVVKEKKERQGRNPRTGETITIAAKRSASFKAGKELSDTLIQSKTENPTT